MLEICPTPNPTLNLPNSDDKCKTDIKNAFVDATVEFELPYMQIWSVLSNCSYTGFDSSTSPYSWATKQTYRLWKPIDMKLDMCDANVQKHQFLNFPAY